MFRRSETYVRTSDRLGPSLKASLQHRIDCLQSHHHQFTSRIAAGMKPRRILRVTTTRNLQEFNVQCSPRSFRACWCLILLFHVDHGTAYGHAMKSLI